MIVRIRNWRELLLYKNSLIEMYVSSFAEPPWNEVHSGDTVEQWFREMLFYPRNIVLLDIGEDGIIGGATFNFSIMAKTDVAHLLLKKIPCELYDICYLAEIFVNPARRQRGIAKRLHYERLRCAEKEGFKAAAERTNPESKMYSLIIESGFQVVCEQEVVSKKRNNGGKDWLPDRRVISLKVF